MDQPENADIVMGEEEDDEEVAQVEQVEEAEAEEAEKRQRKQSQMSVILSLGYGAMRKAWS